MISKGRKPKPEITAMIAEMRKKGLPITEIGRRMRITKQAVWYHISKYNLDK